MTDAEKIEKIKETLKEIIEDNKRYGLGISGDLEKLLKEIESGEIYE